MKMMFSMVLGMMLLSAAGRADAQAAYNTTTDTATNTVAETDEDAVPLKDLMESNNIVTNSVDVILVKINPSLWAGRYEITQKQYQKLMGNNPSQFGGENNPVDSVSWNDAIAFCQKLSDKERKNLPDGFVYALPTEDQWQALAAGTSLQDAVMKLNGDRNTTAAVGSLNPNSRGLYDLRGNVMEWCQDSQVSKKILHGGAWDTWVEPSSRLEFRNYAPADEKKNDYGFRIVLESAHP